MSKRQQIEVGGRELTISNAAAEVVRKGFTAIETPATTKAGTGMSGSVAVASCRIMPTIP